jgi:hypothetical protein
LGSRATAAAENRVLVTNSAVHNWENRVIASS